MLETIDRKCQLGIIFLELQSTKINIPSPAHPSQYSINFNKIKLSSGVQEGRQNTFRESKMIDFGPLQL